MTTSEYLAKFGLSKKQIRIYLDVAAHPDTTVVGIHKRVGEARSSIYLELERLIGQGFVISKGIGKSTYYKITNPKALALNLEQESQKLQFLTQNLESFNREISGLPKIEEAPKTINIYKGQAGIKQLLWNIILSGAHEVIGFSPGQLEFVTDRDFAEKWREEFGFKNMLNRIIFNQPKPLNWSDVPGFLEHHVEARTLDEREIKFDRTTLIYNDVLTVCSLKTDPDQYGVEIKDKLLVSSHKQIFNFLWDHVAKKIK